MRKRAVVVAALSLLLVFPISAEAAPKTTQNLTSLGFDAADACNATAVNGTVLGEVSIQKKGKSNGGSFQLQVKLKGGATVASANYAVALLTVTGGTPGALTCSSTDIGNLKTNKQGTGVLNFGYNLTGNSANLRVVLVDPWVSPAGKADVATPVFTLSK